MLQVPDGCFATPFLYVPGHGFAEINGKQVEALRGSVSKPLTATAAIWADGNFWLSVTMMARIQGGSMTWMGFESHRVPVAFLEAVARLFEGSYVALGVGDPIDLFPDVGNNFTMGNPRTGVGIYFDSTKF